MVDYKRVITKIPSLLLNGNTTNKKNWKILMRTRYRVAQFKKRNPEKFNMIINKIVIELNELDKEVNA